MTPLLKNDPIFILSSERSGSNLLRVLLGNHPHIAAPRALQLLVTFRNSIHCYGPLENKEAIQKLFGDCARLAAHPYHDWNVAFDFDYMLDAYAPRDFISLFNAVYSEYARQKKRCRFVCKEINLFDFALQLKSYYAHPFFLYLYRDPRDYAASWNRFAFGPPSTYCAAVKWADEQKRCLEVMGAMHGNVLALSYEALIMDTESVMRTVLAFLGEPFDAACCSIRAGSNEDAAWNPLWKNLNRPIDRANFNTYNRTLSSRKVAMIETVAKEPMKRLGYAFDTDADWRPNRLFSLCEDAQRRAALFRKRYAPGRGLRLLRDRRKLVQSILKARKEGR